MSHTGLRMSSTQKGTHSKGDRFNGIFYLCLCAVLLCTALLFLIPQTRKGTEAICNKIFALSEAANSYLYDTFPVDAGQDTWPAVFLLLLIGISWTGCLILCRTGIPILITAVLLALAQAYFGLSFPIWINVPVYTGLGLLLMKPLSLQRAAAAAGAAALIFAGLFFLYPQQNAEIERISEQVRDYMTPAAQNEAGGLLEDLDGPLKETRHVNMRDLSQGESDALLDSEYRMVTVEEEQISMPHWFDYLRTLLLLMAVLLLVTVPFIPFAILNRRRNMAQEARSAFVSENRSEAVCSVFRHVVRYLEKTGHGGGNALYRIWDTVLSSEFSADYVSLYRECSVLFEEAKYSGHEMTEEQLGRVWMLLSETERYLFDQADWRQRFRLRYVECLHE